MKRPRRTAGRRRDPARPPGAAAPLVLALLPLALALAACGVKTHPYPESSTLPAKVVNMRQEQDSQGRLRLSWNAPVLNMVGRPLKVLAYFEVWGADYGRADFCEGCPSMYRKLGEVHLQPPPPGLEINEGPYYWGAELRQGRVYRYRVAGFSSRGTAHPEAWAEVTVYADEPPGPLEAFSATPEDLAVRIGFRPAPADEILEVQRREGDGPWQRLNLSGSGYVDLDVAYGKAYTYRGRRIRRDGDSRIPGPWSREATVGVEDVLPLRPVGHLDASLGAEGVVLRWESLADEPGLAGYRLYRRLGPDGEFQRLGGLLAVNAYVDREAPPGADIRYMVTAVDNSPRANESLGSPEASVRVEEEEEPEERPDLRDLGY
ncbi:MAG: hypothetical protein LBW85_11130 [Deltaproteobacteria bacterium]|jgi:hypothetical protein|nr:hypothetical protein [Deltaproteobacteria bacterium]